MIFHSTKKLAAKLLDVSPIPPDDPTLIYAFRRIPEFGNRVLRVVYNQTRTPPHIVMAYSTGQEANDEIRLRSPSGRTVHSAQRSENH